MRNAAVFPVPVCACPATSLPLSPIGNVCAWIGVQLWKPASRMPCAREGSRFSESKLVKLLWGSLIKRPIARLVGSGGLEKEIRKRYKVNQQGGHSHPQLPNPDQPPKAKHLVV